MNVFNAVLTFDVDYMDYISNTPFEEFDVIINDLIPYFKDHDIKATWFIRIDKQIEQIYGQADYFFTQYQKEISTLKSLGHAIGWHPHYYTKHHDQWVQNTNEIEILDELNYLFPIVKKHHLDIVRVGWGFQTNSTMQRIAEAGFKLDSSCMARPKYTWDLSVKDWQISSNNPFYPSKQDYRIEADDNYDLLEIPITMIPFPLSSDTEANVKRYVNLSTHSHILKPHIDHYIDRHDDIVLISHPYELFADHQHAMISFDFEEFKKNIKMMKDLCQLKDKELKFITITDLKMEFENAKHLA